MIRLSFGPLFLVTQLALCCGSPAITAMAEPAPYPIIKTELSAPAVVPGQLSVLKITLLVPTWMPKPPVLPDFDLPDLMVRLPERATLPISRRIEGQVWSGVSRSYHLYPLAPGDFSLPAQAVSITYADPQTRAPIVFEGSTEAVSVRARIPEAAKDLDPFIAATGFRISEKIEGDFSGLEAGDAIVRELKVETEGATPLMIPPILTQHALRGLSPYQREPRVIEVASLGATSGTRIEEVTYIVEAGGRFKLPAAELRWFNLNTGTIEIASVKGVDIRADGPPLSWAKEMEYLGYDTLRWVLIVLSLTILSAGGWALRRRALGGYRTLRTIYLGSERYAFQLVIRRLEKRQLGPALNATRYWWDTFNFRSRRPPMAQGVGFLALGERLYGRSAGVDLSDELLWVATAKTLRETRQKSKGERQKWKADSLRHLNPVHSDILTDAGIERE